MTEDMGAAASEAATSAADASEAAVQRIRELTERFIEAAKKAGNVSLYAYERSLQTLVEFEERAGGALLELDQGLQRALVGVEGHVAGASQLDWVATIAAAHAK